MGAIVKNIIIAVRRKGDRLSLAGIPAFSARSRSGTSRPARSPDSGPLTIPKRKSALAALYEFTA